MEVETARDHLRTILSTDSGINTLLAQEESEVPLTVDLLHMEIQATLSDPGQAKYRRKCMKCLTALLNKHHILPSSLFVEDVAQEGKFAVASGSFADIYKGTYRGRLVCLKVLRFHIQAEQHKKDKIAEEFYKETLVWTQLSHPNVLPFHGVSTTLFPERFCLISPWMENGHIITFLERTPDHDKLKTLVEISAGIAYLHELRIVHGDIKGVNILVDEHGISHLADFGLARVVNETLTLGQSTTGNQKGTTRWMAPELFDFGGDIEPGSNPSDGEERVTAKSDKFPRDIYAFACTVLEIITGKPPFAHIRNDATVMY
ncbi:hypothetical protein AAF712_003409 [Marasmius tenuissimus]|uniref:Protein kinase domain-containing protein n=1 Tax=Marasmius tenuissimus TaxID=585030 RepID=A0ABR3A670_9AGAR